MVRWLLLLVLAAAGVGACTLFDEDPPDDSCMFDGDCFRAQGERCNQDTHRCEVPVIDAAVVGPVDAGVDAP